MPLSTGAQAHRTSVLCYAVLCTSALRRSRGSLTKAVWMGCRCPYCDDGGVQHYKISVVQLVWSCCLWLRASAHLCVVNECRRGFPHDGVGKERAANMRINALEASKVASGKGISCGLAQCTITCAVCHGQPRVCGAVRKPGVAQMGE